MWATNLGLWRRTIRTDCLHSKLWNKTKSILGDILSIHGCSCRCLLLICKHLFLWTTTSTFALLPLLWCDAAAACWLSSHRGKQKQVNAVRQPSQTSQRASQPRDTADWCKTCLRSLLIPRHSYGRYWEYLSEKAVQYELLVYSTARLSLVLFCFFPAKMLRV